MDLRLDGKVAIVAAASKGLGKATALVMAHEGVNLAICAREKTALLETTKEIESITSVKVLPVVADVTDPENIKNLVKSTAAKFGRIDILVANAGGPPAGSFYDFRDQDWQDAVTLNLLSTVRLCREVIPYMRKQGSGRIINIISIAGKQPIDRLILSNVVRAAAIGLAKTLSNELAVDNILVNNICPGWISTDRLLSIVHQQAASEGKSFESTLKNKLTTSL